jgi:voltage-gated potassium channel Kch
VGELHQIETAVYFSTSTFTTVGFGDVILSHKWRMLGVAESMNGFLLISWSTAFLVSLTARVRAFEAKIEGRDD